MELMNYFEEMREVLETRDVNKLEEFIEKWAKKGVLENRFYLWFKHANDMVKLGTLCKMICNKTNLTPETIEWAKQQLDKLGWDYEI